MYLNSVLFGVRERAKSLLEKAIINGDTESVNKYHDLIEDLDNAIDTKTIRQDRVTHSKKSSRFSRPKSRPNVSRDAASMGYAKPIQHQRISYKYNCMVTGVKRMDTCAGCSNPKGCLSNSMQYKEQDQ
jgi:hypothetical protein